MSPIPQDQKAEGRGYGASNGAEGEQHDGDLTIAPHTPPGPGNGLAGATLIGTVLDTLTYVSGEIKAGRYVGDRKTAPKTVILHNCKFSIKAIRMLGLTGETQVFALRALYPSVGRVERDLFPVIADLLKMGTEEPSVAGRHDAPNSGPPIRATRKVMAVF